MKKRSIFTYIISLLLSNSIVLTFYIQEKGSFKESFFYKFHFNILFFLLVIFLSFILYFVLNKFILNIYKISIKKSENLFDKNKIFCISFITIFISGLLFLLTYYPGTCMVDTLQILYDPIIYSSQYPLYYSLIQSSLFHFFLSIFGTMNFSFFLLSLIQLLFMTFIISYIITWTHITIKSNKVTIINIVYFNVFTIFSNLNSAHLRDTIFAAFVMLLIPIIYNIVCIGDKYLNNKIFLIKFTFVLCLLSLVRNNGIFMVAFLIIILCIKYKKYIKKFLLILLFILLIINSPKLLPRKYQREPLFQEQIAVPLQQVFYLVKYNKMNDDDLKYIDRLIPLTMVEQSYNPFCIDSLKWHGYFERGILNDTKYDFLKIWLKYMMPNFEDYIKVYLTNSYSLWSIHEFSLWESRFLKLDLEEYNVGYYFEDLENKSIFPEQIQNKLEKFYKFSCRYVNNATLFWLYVLLAIVLIYKNKKKYLLIFVPFFGIWLNLMLAAPLSSAFRYMCSFGYALPFIISIVFSEYSVDSKL